MGYEQDLEANCVARCYESSDMTVKFGWSVGNFVHLEIDMPAVLYKSRWPQVQ